MRFKIKCIIIIISLFCLAGCGGGGGGGGGSSGGSGGGSSGGGGSSDTTVTRNYTANSFSSTQRGMLMVFSAQATYSLPYYTLYITGSLARESKAAEFKEEFTESKDLPKDIQEYAERVNKTEGVNYKKLKGIKAFNVGDQNTFYILQDGATLTTCTAQCYAKGTNCYIFIDTASTNITGADRTTIASNIATAFDSDNSPFNAGNGIYNTTRSYFGSEWTPGIDNDSRVFILISSKLDTNLSNGILYGYFYSLDETTGSGSNQKEIIYTHDILWTGNMYNGLATITHEFQHLIDYNEKYRGGGSFEDNTINEGKSMLSEHLNGFTVSAGGSYSGNGYMIRAVRGFINTPHNFKFFSWAGGYDYGAAYLFMLYIYERFGTGTLQGIAQSSSVSSSNIAAYTGVSFASLFKDWCLINYYDGLTSAPSQYANINLVGTYTGYTGYDNSTTASYTLSGIASSDSVSSYPTSGTVYIYSWSPDYIKFTSTQTRNLSVQFQALTKYSTYSNFILESPTGTYNSEQ